MVWPLSNKLLIIITKCIRDIYFIFYEAEDDDFGYATEMAAWLNEGDINLRPGTTIDQFFARETSPVLSRSVRGKFRLFIP